MTLRRTVLFCVFVSTAATVAAHSPWLTVSNQPTNVGDAAVSARAYHASGAYAVGLKQVADKAISWIIDAGNAPALAHLIRRHRPSIE